MLSLSLPSLKLCPLKSVPSHLTWTEDYEFVRRIPRSVLGNAESMVQHIANLNMIKNNSVSALANADAENTIVSDEPEDRQKEYKQDNDDTGSQKDRSQKLEKSLPPPPSMHFISTKLCRAALFAYIGDFQSSEKHMNELLQIVDILKQIPNQNYKRAIKYCLDALQWSLNLLKGSPEVDLSLASKLKARWTNLLANKEAMAVIVFFRADIGTALRVIRTKVLLLRKESVELDPNFHVWQYHLFHELRGIRLQFSKGKAPCEEERRACVAVYRLTPSDEVHDRFWATYDHAILLKDTLLAKRIWDEEEALDCEAVIREALRHSKGLAKRNKYRNEIGRMITSLADILISGKWTNPRWREGQQLLEKSSVDFPKFWNVWLSLAKFYHFGFGSDKLGKSVEDALRCYGKAMELAPWNFESVNNYIKLLGEVREIPIGWQESLLAAFDNDKFTPTHQASAAQLRIWKGCLVWIFNPGHVPNNREQACAIWLNALEKYEFYELTLRNIWDPPYYIQELGTGKTRKAQINVEEVMKTLEDMQGIYPNEMVMTNFIAMIC